MTYWSLQDAKSNLGALVKAALAGDPQWVIRRGQPAVVVLAAEEYDRLRRLEKAGAPTLGELLLEIPQDDGEFDRLGLPTGRWTCDVSPRHRRAVAAPQARTESWDSPLG